MGQAEGGLPEHKQAGSRWFAAAAGREPFVQWNRATAWTCLHACVIFVMLHIPVASLFANRVFSVPAVPRQRRGWMQICLS